jgi:eukaryotic-like serine/threonine-protein kinase
MSVAGDLFEWLRGLAGPEPFAGRFHIEREAGAGGMGMVYRARDVWSGKIVALKVSCLAGPASACRACFATEAAILSRLDHPAVVRFVEHGVTRDGEPFLSMEWIDGRSLGARLARGALAVEEAVALGVRLADGLSAVHESGFVHLDINPSNILLPGGRFAGAKIIDLGLARLAGQCAAPSRAARSSASMSLAFGGTPGYIAPEQARGETDLDGRTDLFALGCVLFLCLTGRSAAGPAPRPPRVAASRRDVPADLDELVARLLANDRQERPSTAAAVRAELDAVLRILPTARAG